MFPEDIPAKAGMEVNGTWHERFLPTFFQAGERRLYACHHFPPKPATGAEAVLICNAVAHEYERCHRSLRQLAMQFANAGYHAMRFDYFGTGDSAGEYTQVSFNQWRQDVANAIDECKRLSGRERVCIVGMRLGATLAAQAAAERDDVEALVLYAPVTDSRALLSEWEQEQAKHDSKMGRSPRQGIAGEVLGFPLTDAFRAELNSELVLPAPGASLRQVLMLAENIGGKEVRQLAEIMGNGGASVSVVSADAATIWRREPSEAIVPFKLIRHIVKWLNGVRQ